MIKTFINHNGPCPYLEVCKQWITESFYNPHISGFENEAYMLKGFRRMGASFYRNICKNCIKCVPLRVDVKKFQLSHSQKRVLKKNSDLSIVYNQHAVFSEEALALYNDYIKARHNQDPIDRADFEKYLNSDFDFCKVVNFYLNKKLVAVSWIDVLFNSINSIYSIYLPNEHKRSLGVLSALYEINLARNLGLDWYYMGYWVKDSSKMRYKSQYRPCQVLVQDEWIALH